MFYKCNGYWVDDPDQIIEVVVSSESWDGLEDGKDNRVFYYMDNQPLFVGSFIAEDFIVTSIKGDSE
jgi:hypothetical protein|tara:strand:- start:353 stop:553 length:201 start_codon:yes stop_codon:yes gene_type:complete